MLDLDLGRLGGEEPPTRSQEAPDRQEQAQDQAQAATTTPRGLAASPRGGRRGGRGRSGAHDRGLPQDLQKRASGVALFEHAGHTRGVRGAPQALQKRDPFRLPRPQRGQGSPAGEGLSGLVEGGRGEAPGGGAGVGGLAGKSGPKGVGRGERRGGERFRTAGLAGDGGVGASGPGAAGPGTLARFRRPSRSWARVAFNGERRRPNP